MLFAFNRTLLEAEHVQLELLNNLFLIVCLYYLSSKISMENCAYPSNSQAHCNITYVCYVHMYRGDVAQEVRAVVWRSEGRRFDPTPGASKCP